MSGRLSNRQRGKETLRDQRGELLFIDARNLGALVDRTRRELGEADIQKIADTYHAWRSTVGAGLVPARDKADPAGAGLVPARDKGDHKGRPYEDIPGFCKSATLDDIRKHGHVLTPGRYIGAEATEDDFEPFTDKMQRPSAQWREQQQEAAQRDAATSLPKPRRRQVEVNLREIGYGG